MIKSVKNRLFLPQNTQKSVERWKFWLIVRLVRSKRSLRRSSDCYRLWRSIASPPTDVSAMPSALKWALPTPKVIHYITWRAAARFQQVAVFTETILKRKQGLVRSERNSRRSSKYKVIYGLTPCYIFLPKGKNVIYYDEVAIVLLLRRNVIWYSFSTRVSVYHSQQGEYHTFLNILPLDRY